MSSHDASATACNVWASNSNTPQLIAGSRSPKPRKLSDVSAMMMPGMASVVAAMMWLRNDGSIWRNTMRTSFVP